MNIQKGLFAFEQQLPRRLRRHWSVFPWVEPEVPLTQREQEKTAYPVYLKLLDFGLKNHLKLVTETTERSLNPYATLLWNLACFDRFRFEDFNTKMNWVSKNRDCQLKQWLHSMYLRYPLPAWGYQALLNAENPNSAIEFLFRWGNGTSPRDIFPLSKQENLLIQTCDISFPVLSEVLAYCSALAAGCPPPLAEEIAFSLNQTFQTPSPERALFYGRLIAPWIRSQVGLKRGELIDLCDFWKDAGLFSGFYSLKRRTLNSVRRAMVEWHTKLYDYNQGTQSWEKHGFDLFIANQGIEFREINTVQGLQQEGRRQHNCVAAYASKCLSGKCAIVSIYSMPENVRVTMEINLKTSKIVQMKEVCNSSVQSRFRQYIKKFAADKKLVIAA